MAKSNAARERPEKSTGTRIRLSRMTRPGAKAVPLQSAGIARRLCGERAKGGSGCAAHGEHRAAGMTQYLLGHRAEDQVRKARPAARSHDDEVASLRRADDGIGGRPLEEPRADEHARIGLA